MGKLFVIQILMLYFIINATNGLNIICPPSSKLLSCSPQCKTDSSCLGEKCCPNICGTKSCASANLNHSSDKYKGTSSKGATGTYCGNVKCNVNEKCDLDRTTKRQKCVRQ